MLTKISSDPFTRVIHYESVTESTEEIIRLKVGIHQWILSVFQPLLFHGCKSPKNAESIILESVSDWICGIRGERQMQRNLE